MPILDGGVTMNCLNCGDIMEKGYLCAGGYRIIWTKKSRKFSAHVDEEDVKLQGLTLLGNNDVVAFICKRCKKIMIDYH